MTVGVAGMGMGLCIQRGLGNIRRGFCAAEFWRPTGQKTGWKAERESEGI